MKKRGIKFKIVVSVISVVTICLGIVGLMAYQYLQNMLMEDALRESETKVNDIMVRLETMGIQINNIANYIITDQAVIDHLTVTNSETIKDKNDASYEMSHILTRFVVINDYISNIYVERSDGWIYSSKQELDNRYLKPYLADIVDWEKLKVDNNFFSDIHHVPATRSTNFEHTLSFVVRFSLLGKSDFAEHLIISLDYDIVKQMIEQGSIEFAHVSLYNHDGNILYGDDDDFSRSNKDTVLIEKQSESGNWKVVVSISKDTLFSKISNVLMWFLFITIAIVIVLIVVLVYVTSKITKPIEELSQGMKNVEEGLYDTQVIVNSNDEIEELANVFNGMTSKIQKHIEESIQHEQTKQELQLDVLMNQINPHFIYNTLNSIIYCARRAEPVGVETITKALIHILQDSVKIGKHAIKDIIGVELDIVKNYMKIQEYRYPKRFEFDLSCSEDLYDIEIPKMMIQPLVENSLFHGVCLREIKGKIIIKLQRRILNNQHWIEIVVKDNGVGMSKEQVAQCFAEKTTRLKSNKTRSIGLSNIKKRLNFLYKEDYYIKIWSKESLGTIITIGFPK